MAFKDNKTGYPGVQKSRNKYSAKVFVNGKRIFLGMFKTAKEASEAYLKATTRTDKPSRKQKKEKVYSKSLSEKWKKICPICPGNQKLGHCWETGE